MPHKFVEGCLDGSRKVTHLPVLGSHWVPEAQRTVSHTFIADCPAGGRNCLQIPVLESHEVP